MSFFPQGVQFETCCSEKTFEEHSADKMMMVSIGPRLRINYNEGYLILLEELMSFNCNPVKTPLRIDTNKKNSQYSRHWHNQMGNKLYYYIDTDEIPGFFLLLKNYIFIARSEDTIRFLVSPWLLTSLANYRRPYRSGALPVLLKFLQNK